MSGLPNSSTAWLFALALEGKAADEEGQTIEGTASALAILPQQGATQQDSLFQKIHSILKLLP